MKDGFLRICAATPRIKTANPEYNAGRIIELIQKAAANGAKVTVLPELCLTGYTCQDLFFQSRMLEEAEQQLHRILTETAGLDTVWALGLPVPVSGGIYNCAAVGHKGRLLGVTPKRNLPNYAEFYEMRHFIPAGMDEISQITLCGQKVPFGDGMVYPCENVKNLAIGVEICEDLWVPLPPSSEMALDGATIILNLSASNDGAGKGQYRRMLIASQSGRCICTYAYCGAGMGESTTDLTFNGHRVIYENGRKLAEDTGWGDGEDRLTYADTDLQLLNNDRTRINSFIHCRTGKKAKKEGLPFALEINDLELIRAIDATPFVPHESARLKERCEEIIAIQSNGLAGRMLGAGFQKAVVALSGGLDSTLALLVTARAFDTLKLPHQNISVLNMPGFGTTKGTKSNAEALANALQTEYREIPISKAVELHLSDIGHGIKDCDIAYENAQARERTQIAMDTANMLGALMVGTGDMSELALGWTTYAGDHMSMYGVNAGVPKTLVKFLVKYFADTAEDEAVRSTLLSVLDTPISPELTPPKGDEIAQLTEEIIGPYDLHDFFLYHMIRYGFGPAKVLRMAKKAFAGRFADEEIKKWLKLFITRFFRNQFKRSCLPDGPKVGTVALSPRGDWRMPSDADAGIWLKELE